MSETWPGSTYVGLLCGYSYYFSLNDVKFILSLLTWGRVIRTAYVPSLKGRIAVSFTVLTNHSAFIYFIYFEWVWLSIVKTLNFLIKKYCCVFIYPRIVPGLVLRTLFYSRLILVCPGILKDRGSSLWNLSYQFSSSVLQLFSYLI